MTDEQGDLDSGPETIKLPDTTRASLREWVETKDPVALEAFLTSIVEIETEAHSGPLPTPKALKDYDKVLPGLAERIVRLAEVPHEELAREQIHRHDLERDIVRHTARYKTIGLWMGFAVAILSLSGAFYCAARSEWTGVIGFLCLPLAGVVSVLVSGKPWQGAGEKVKA